MLPADVAAEQLIKSVDDYRDRLERTTGSAVDAEAWRGGFRAAMALLLIDRLAFYAMIHRVRRQTFLPRVLRTWRRVEQVTR